MIRPGAPGDVPPPSRESVLSYFDGLDLAALLALTAIAFVLRFFSPILPDFFLHPTSGPWITNCVSSTPIDAAADLGTICGLAYPFNQGYPDQNGQLEPPNGQVFDEVYFPVDAQIDFKNTNCHEHDIYCPYFDPEPPLAKLIIGAGEWGYGWFRATFQGAHGAYIDLGFNTFGWRIASCIFGTLCIPFMYLLARRLWPNRLFAIAAATLVCFDGMFFVQSRIGMIDIFPVFFILLSYFLFLVHIQSDTFKGSLVSLVALGVVLGLGIAAKWIVLAAWASIVFLLVVRIGLRAVGVEFGPPGWRFAWPSGDDKPAPKTLWPTYVAVAVVALVVIPVGIYVLSWFPFFLRGQFLSLTDLWNYQVASYEYHKNLTATHPYGSPAWSWPFLARPVLYYAQYSGLGIDQFTGQDLWARISNMGNPWIWWTSLPCMLSMPYFIVRYRSFPAAVILLGFITQYLPWFPITRVLFLYHMFGGLIFMVLAAAFVVTHLAMKLPRPNRNLLVAAYLGTAVLFFGYFYPVWTAVPISQSAWFEGDGTPPWGPKMWLLNCRDLPQSQPQIFCWN